MRTFIGNSLDLVTYMVYLEMTNQDEEVSEFCETLAAVSSVGVDILDLFEELTAKTLRQLGENAGFVAEPAISMNATPEEAKIQSQVCGYINAVCAGDSARTLSLAESWVQQVDGNPRLAHKVKYLLLRGFVEALASIHAHTALHRPDLIPKDIHKTARNYKGRSANVSLN